MACGHVQAHDVMSFLAIRHAMHHDINLCWVLTACGNQCSVSATNTNTNTYVDTLNVHNNVNYR